ncbi:hypothetical protein TEHN7118_1712 [Tetragenococcus halophilus subsp. halophilus]|uniref:Uncharacterized protein n=1 Tax=Tetragenococcus halophilus subsp. halophilus TaxID=1513897 RepID=A0A2H6CV93_TETHA|nr:hypothetical protein TEHN7118_1712 [Tetragenococcus halophilus subsp. halophilus]GMG65129.1 hypothetical protein TEHIT2_03200 [Tetragenococcus halophilus]
MSSDIKSNRERAINSTFGPKLNEIRTVKRVTVPSFSKEKANNTHFGPKSSKGESTNSYYDTLLII